MSENKISFMNINKTIGLLCPESYKIYTTKYKQLGRLYDCNRLL